MPALGMGLGWGAYALMSWGYILLRGYNVKFSDWVNPFHYYSGDWPPPTDIPPSSVLPTGTAAKATATAKGKPKPKGSGGGGLPVVAL